MALTNKGGQGFEGLNDGITVKQDAFIYIGERLISKPHSGNCQDYYCDETSRKEINLQSSSLFRANQPRLSLLAAFRKLFRCFFFSRSIPAHKTNDDVKSRLKSLETEVQKMKEQKDKTLPTKDSLPAVQKDSIIGKKSS